MEPKKEPLTESYFYILLCLYRHANHGYGIMQEAGELSGGRVRIGSGTMYGAVSNMMKKGWIAECDAEPGMERRGSRNTGVRKKLYVLTDTGRQALEAELVRLIEMLKSAEKIIGRPPELLLKK
ncbi:MAG: PadR family transcriptional regulator [Eisenbergiella massiliensis]